MRYLICKNNVSNEEVIARIEYIYELFHIYTLKDNKNSNKDITILNSIPSHQPNILMIIGHDPITNNYIIQNIDTLPEKDIIIISCNTKKIKKLKNIHDKNIYLPSNSTKVNYCKGKEIGFDFDITDEEVMLYRNRTEDIYTMLNNSLERMKINGKDN